MSNTKLFLFIQLNLIFVVNIITMDLQTRKLNVIEYLIRIQDDNMIQEIEKLIAESKIHGKNFQ